LISVIIIIVTYAGIGVGGVQYTMVGGRSATDSRSRAGNRPRYYLTSTV
jgi:hypothetical protein